MDVHQKESQICILTEEGTIKALIGPPSGDRTAMIPTASVRRFAG
jgi:hypothetical protein